MRLGLKTIAWGWPVTDNLTAGRESNNDSHNRLRSASLTRRVLLRIALWIMKLNYNIIINNIRIWIVKLTESSAQTGQTMAGPNGQMVALVAPGEWTCAAERNGQLMCCAVLCACGVVSLQSAQRPEWSVQVHVANWPAHEARQEKTRPNLLLGMERRTRNVKHSNRIIVLCFYKSFTGYLCTFLILYDTVMKCTL